MFDNIAPEHYNARKKAELHNALSDYMQRKKIQNPEIGMKRFLQESSPSITFEDQATMFDTFNDYDKEKWLEQNDQYIQQNGNTTTIRKQDTTIPSYYLAPKTAEAISQPKKLHRTIKMSEPTTDTEAPLQPKIPRVIGVFDQTTPEETPLQPKIPRVIGIFDNDQQTVEEQNLNNTQNTEPFFNELGTTAVDTVLADEAATGLGGALVGGVAAYKTLDKALEAGRDNILDSIASSASKKDAIGNALDPQLSQSATTNNNNIAQSQQNNIDGKEATQIPNNNMNEELKKWWNAAGEQQNNTKPIGQTYATPNITTNETTQISNGSIDETLNKLWFTGNDQRQIGTTAVTRDEPKQPIGKTYVTKDEPLPNMPLAHEIVKQHEVQRPQLIGQTFVTENTQQQDSGIPTNQSMPQFQLLNPTTNVTSQENVAQTNVPAPVRNPNVIPRPTVDNKPLFFASTSSTELPTVDADRSRVENTGFTPQLGHNSSVKQQNIISPNS